ncbi:hypothetical protein JTB14_009036 [Gonioctena quinquepunctata]|nr:hypothetical protein JTB14_009036 [Gonioctena quinquepunctata]
MIERFHRQLKTAIKCHSSQHWTKTLPTTVLGIRSSWKESTAAEMFNRQTIWIPGEFLTTRNLKSSDSEPKFIENLRKHKQELRSTSGTQHGPEETLLLYT